MHLSPSVRCFEGCGLKGRPLIQEDDAATGAADDAHGAARRAEPGSLPMMAQPMTMPGLAQAALPSFGASLAPLTPGVMAMQRPMACQPMAQLSTSHGANDDGSTAAAATQTSDAWSASTSLPAREEATALYAHCAAGSSRAGEPQIMMRSVHAQELHMQQLLELCGDLQVGLNLMKYVVF